MCYLLRHFDGGFEHAVHFCEICLSHPHHSVKEHCLSVIANLLQETEMDQNFMEGIFTCDQKWVYG